MASKSIKRYMVNPRKADIPDVGLGDFRVGLTEENERFNPKYFLWNLLPFIGQLFFIKNVIKHWWKKARFQRILLYEYGFIKQDIAATGRMLTVSIVDFRETDSIHYRKIRKYENGKYQSTYVDLSPWGSNLIQGDYYNENEIEECHNFTSYAYNTVRDAWIAFAVNHFYYEINAGYNVMFKTYEGYVQKVQIGRNYLKINDTIVSTPFKYSYDYDKELLYLYPESPDNSQHGQTDKPIYLNIYGMCNRDVFIMALNQLHGVNLLPIIESRPLLNNQYFGELQFMESSICHLDIEEIPQWIKQNCRPSGKVDNTDPRIIAAKRQCLNNSAKYSTPYVDWLDMTRPKYCALSALKWIIILGTVIFLAHLPIILD